VLADAIAETYVPTIETGVLCMSHFRNTLAAAVAAVLLLVQPGARAGGGAGSGSGSVGIAVDRVLVLGQTVSGGANSQEARAAAALGFTVEIATTPQWLAKSTANFAAYRAVVLGDPSCGNVSVLNPVIASRPTWGPAINGNVIVIGTDTARLSASTPSPLVEAAMRHATSAVGKTGMYVSLSCYYRTASATPPTPVPVLEPFGRFTVFGIAGNHADVHTTFDTDPLRLSNPDFLKTPPGGGSAQPIVTDANLSNWSTGSVREVMAEYPAADFAPVAIAQDPASGARLPGSRDMPDGSHGAVYVLASRAVPSLCGNGVVDPSNVPVEQCDLGVDNGVPGSGCSALCRSRWCGDGAVADDEQCDLGAANGSDPVTSACTRFCRNGGANRPPVAQCQSALSLVASDDASCNASASIDNGSFDPDGPTPQCTQTPAAPWGRGSRVVQLRCTDAAGASSTCSTPVSVTDRSSPHLDCADTTLECTSSAGASHDFGRVAVVDNCSIGVESSDPVEAVFPVGMSTLMYQASDEAGNQGTCSVQVSVVDTLGPEVSLNGPSTMHLECRRDSYEELGATAVDACSGDVSTTLAIDGSVDTQRIGLHAITYSARDPLGHIGRGQREVFVGDHLAPTISLAGGNVVAGECGRPFEEPGAVATDLCDGDVSNSLVRTPASIDTATAGDRQLRYVAHDDSDNHTVAERTVEVRDRKAPTLMLLGANPMTLQAGTPYAEPGYVAADLCDGDLNGQVVVTGSVGASPGHYVLNYRVIDTAGQAVEQERVVVVAPVRNVLVLLDAVLPGDVGNEPNGPAGSPNLLTQRAFLADQLQQRGMVHTITTSETAFVQALRNGTHTAFLVASEVERLSVDTQFELREAVLAGKGLVLAGDFDLHYQALIPACGAIYHHPVQGVQRVQTDAGGTVPIADDAATYALEVFDAVISGRYESATGQLLGTASVFNRPGQGKAACFGFDLLLNAVRGGGSAPAAHALFDALQRVQP
jgi:hypothetical protein